MFKVLGSTVSVARNTAALVIGKIARIEVPRKMWPELVDMLLHSISTSPSNDAKEATFKALGYVCEEVPEYLHDKSGGILGAIASGMNPAQTDINVKYAATVALTHSLEFIKKNMEIEVCFLIYFYVMIKNKICQSTDLCE